MSTEAMIPSPPRPITASQRKALADLVDLDYEGVKNEIELLASREQDRVLKEVEESSTEVIKAMARMVTDAEKAYKKFRDALDSIREEARGKNIEFEISWNYGNPKFSTKDKNLEERKENAKKEVTRKRREALAHVNRQHSASKRQVLLAGISDEVMNVLDTIPSAASVFESMPTQLT